MRTDNRISVVMVIIIAGARARAGSIIQPSFHISGKNIGVDRCAGTRSSQADAKRTAVGLRVSAVQSLNIERAITSSLINRSAFDIGFGTNLITIIADRID